MEVPGELGSGCIVGAVFVENIICPSKRACESGISAVKQVSRARQKRSLGEGEVVYTIE